MGVVRGAEQRRNTFGLGKRGGWRHHSVCAVTALLLHGDFISFRCLGPDTDTPCSLNRVLVLLYTADPTASLTASFAAGSAGE